MENRHFNVGIIRKKDGLGSISVAVRKRFNEMPDKIFEIHIDEGIAKTATCDFDIFAIKNHKWEDAFTVGVARDVAIAFDGYWQRVKADKLCLVTDELPYIFWVDMDYILYKQLWDDISTRQILATDVVKVNVIRGWKNNYYPAHDHGLVVAYIKNDGKVYYRNYCKQESGIITWETEKEVTQFTGTAVNLNLFITNDYRTGLIIEDITGKSTWFITPRNWAGMAIQTETFLIVPKANVNIIPVVHYKAYTTEIFEIVPSAYIAYLFANQNNEILYAINVPNDDNDWGWIIEFKVKNEIPELSLSNIVTIDVDSEAIIQMASLEHIEDSIYRLHVSDVLEAGFNNVTGDIKITISGAINPAGYTYIDMEKTFTPINLVPTYIPVPEVEAIWNE